MGLSQALTAAVAGLKANQAGLTLVSANVSNADTPGYIRKSVTQAEIAGTGEGLSVRVTAVQRELDFFVQRQLRTENAGASFADVRAKIYSQLQDLFGAPGSSAALETVYNNFTTALQSLSTSPDDPAARSSVLSTAQLLTNQLNQTSQGIQSLRSSAELGIADAVDKANSAITQIADLNERIASSPAEDSAKAALLDQRDALVDQLSQLIDIKVVDIGRGQVSILTNSGVELVGVQPARLTFNAQSTITPTNFWNADPAKSGVGTITLTTPNGNSVDLVQTKAFRSGTIAAYLQLRDQDLVQAQSQLDAIAAAMASALSDKTTNGAVSGSPQALPPPAAGFNGFDVDIGNLSAGNKITVNYTDTATGAKHTLTLVRVDDPSALPLSDDATTTPNDHVVGIDLSGGLTAAALAQINTALGGTGLTASHPPSPPALTPTTLRILDDGAPNTVDINSLSTTTTVTSFNGGSAELPFFTDGGAPYTGAIFANGIQSTGLAARISVNGSLLDDPTKLVKFAPSTASGDSTRPDFILKQLTSSSQLFSPNTGIGSTASPFSGSITNFLRQVISQQGQIADSADNLKQGQDIVLNSLRQRFDEASGVNIDQEMASLITLQNAYAANARVLSAVQNMLDTLLRS